MVADWDAERADDLAADIAMEDAQDHRTGEDPPEGWEPYKPRHSADVFEPYGSNISDWKPCRAGGSTGTEAPC